MPVAGRVRDRAIEQRQARLGRAQEGIERPAAVRRSCAARSAPDCPVLRFFEMEESLLFRPAGGRLEDDFDGEPRRGRPADSRQRAAHRRRRRTATARPRSVSTTTRLRRRRVTAWPPIRSRLVETPLDARLAHPRAVADDERRARTAPAHRELRRPDRSELPSASARAERAGSARPCCGCRRRSRCPISCWIGKRRRVGVVADVGLREVAGRRRPRARALVRMACCSRAARASSPAAFSARRSRPRIGVAGSLPGDEDTPATAARRPPGASGDPFSASARRHRLLRQIALAQAGHVDRGGTRCSGPSVLFGLSST